MKYDLTSNLILFRPVTKVKYINNCKAVFNLKHMGLFMIYQIMWALRSLIHMFLWEKKLVLNTKAFFGLFFFAEIGKKGLIYYKVYILRTSYVEKCLIDYWCVTWVENKPPANFEIVIPIVVCQVHQNQNNRGLMHIELNYICIIHLQLSFWQRVIPLLALTCVSVDRKSVV